MWLKGQVCITQYALSAYLFRTDSEQAPIFKVNANGSSIYPHFVEACTYFIQNLSKTSEMFMLYKNDKNVSYPVCICA